jgi:hypothetical protein
MKRKFSKEMVYPGVKCLQSYTQNRNDFPLLGIYPGARDGALRVIAEKDFHGPFRPQAEEFIDVGVAVYCYGNHVKASFGPK